MTLTDLDRKSAALESLRAWWEAKLTPAVKAKVADAHAHALKALTDSLKATPDGRASILRLNRSPSFLAALARLDELWAWLAGPSEVSQEGKVRDARNAMFWEACRLWFPLVPEQLRSRDDWAPPPRQAAEVRAWPVHGYDVRKVLEGPVKTAQRSLKAALEQAGRRSTPGKVEDDLLRAWETRTAAAIAQTVVALLNDSVEHADNAAGRGLVHPDYLDDRPVSAGA